MPIYEYECEKCFHKFELLQNVKEEGGVPCPKCQSHSRRILSPISYVWKGTRFSGENISKKKDSMPNEPSGNKSEIDKNRKNSKKDDKPTPIGE